MFLNDLVEMYKLGKRINKEFETSVDRGNYTVHNGQRIPVMTRAGRRAYQHAAHVVQGHQGMLYHPRRLTLEVAHTLGILSNPLRLFKTVDRIR